MVRGPISAAVMAGWLSTNAIASWMSVIPACSASWASSSTASSLRWLAGWERSKRSGSRLGARGGLLPGVLAPAARQPAAGQRAVGHDAHAVPQARGQHVGLDGADEDRVRRLLGDEPLQAAGRARPTAPPRSGCAGNVERADVADLALVHEVGERAERLLDVGARIGAVDLVEVDPVGAEPPQPVLDRAHDPAARVALLVGVLAHRVVELGGQHDVVAPAPASALPTISSDSPCPYTSAVSMKLIPASSAA